MPKSRKRARRGKKPAVKRAANAPRTPDLATILALLTNRLEGAAPKSDLGRAQDKAFEAMDADDRATRIALAREALAISPICADAHLILAIESDDSEEALIYCRHAVEAGAQALGEAVFEEDAGHFWGFVETRPYMRARLELARRLHASGRTEEAVGHYSDMLRLNPNDNQGVRYGLADALLELGRGDQAGQLLDDYKEDQSAAWAWSAALLAFRRHGKGADSLHALKRALKSNRHVPEYLLGRTRLPPTLPDFIGMGDRNEAIAYVFGADSVWRETEGAKAWVEASLVGGRSRK